MKQWLLATRIAAAASDSSSSSSQPVTCAVSPAEGALCGSLSGALAAAATTPMDVLKTREMLQTNTGAGRVSVVAALRKLYGEGGVRVLFLGVQPRVLWIGIGGFVYFGSYEYSMQLFE